MTVTGVKVYNIEKVIQTEYKRRCTNSVVTFIMEQFYLHHSSEDSKTYFPGNDALLFFVSICVDHNLLSSSCKILFLYLLTL